MNNSYYNLVNEGGEGYKPAPKESGEPLWSILAGKRDRLQRIINGTSEDDMRMPALRAEYAELCAAAKAAISAEMGG